MCYTASISLYAFIINLVSSLALYGYAKHYVKEETESKTLVVVSMTVMYVGIMQLFEYVFWTQRRNDLNALTTKAAMLANHSQPLFLYAMSNYMLGSVPAVVSAVAALYFLVVTFYSIRLWPTLKYTEVTRTSAPSLFWAWTVQPYAYVVYSLYIATIALLCWTTFSRPYHWLVTALFLGQFLFAALKYAFVKSTGRFWCFMFSFTALIVLGVAVVKSIL